MYLLQYHSQCYTCFALISVRRLYYNRFKNNRRSHEGRQHHIIAWINSSVSYITSPKERATTSITGCEHIRCVHQTSSLVIPKIGILSEKYVLYHQQPETHFLISHSALNIMQMTPKSLHVSTEISWNSAELLNLFTGRTFLVGPFSCPATPMWLRILFYI